MLSFFSPPRATRRALDSPLWAPLAVLLFALTACGGGASTDNNSASSTSTPGSCSGTDCGTLFVGITDADGDFLSYSVDVVSLTLKKANGASVETLPTSMRVDFAQLVDLTEFVTAATVPGGSYVEGTIRLDYSNADVTVEVDGEPRAATVVGADGQPLETVDVRILLDTRNHVFIAPARPALLQLDFDLAASHTVDLSQTPVRAVAEPFIVATVEPVDEKELRVRGPLLNVDTAASSYTIDIRPFHHRDARLGRLTVNTTAQTEYEIDGQSYTGAAGLDALARLDTGSPTVAFGTLTVTNRDFTAERVHAGTSVPGPRFDVLWGNVTSRTADTLTVRGGTLIRRSGSVAFVRGDITLLVGPDTGVTRDGNSGEILNEDAISVGQRIHAFGNASDNNGAITLDAQQGRVRLELTHLAGTVKSANPGNVTLDLSSIDGRRVQAFNFAGTGVAPQSDADPANYEIVTGNLTLSRLDTDSPARVFGFVMPFGAAPPDFEGRTVVDFEEVRAILGIGWAPSGTSAPFLRIDAGGIVLDNTNPDIGVRHFIAIGPRLIDIKALATPPTVVPAFERGLYAIGEPGRIEVFSDFAALSARLSEKLGAGSKALAMSAGGQFESGTSTLAALHVGVSLSARN